MGKPPMERHQAEKLLVGKPPVGKLLRGKNPWVKTQPERLRKRKTAGEAPTGEANHGEDKGRSGGSFVSSGEEIIVQIDDSITIKVMQEGKIVDGTIEDLTESSIVKVTYGDENKVAELQIVVDNSQGKEIKISLKKGMSQTPIPFLLERAKVCRWM